MYNNGKTYAFNLDKICEFINYSDNAKSKETEIIDTYDYAAESDETTGSKLAAKTVRELTTPGNAQVDNIRYDLLKTLLYQVIGYNEEDSGEVTDLPFGVKVCFNTMINHGFLKEV